MPLQNRVTPFGDIVAIPQRGLFTGNRGIIHDPATKTLLRKRWSSKAWIVCALSYKDHRRDVMATRSWTELFFLDEAVALAAGHRPCFACRREAAQSFSAAWAKAKGLRKVSAPDIDAVLHRERLHKNDDVEIRIDQLPDGVVVARHGDAFTLARGRAFQWTEAGYASPTTLKNADAVITPPSTVAAIAAGYTPALHPAIEAHLRS